MGTFFSDPLHDEFGSWILGFVPYGGGTVGELAEIAGQVTAGDDGSFYEAFSAFADRLLDEADRAAEAGHDRTAHECSLRAAALLGVAYHPLFGTPVDPRLLDAFRRQQDAFARAMALAVPAGEPVDVPYEGTTLPAWFVRTPLAPDERRPTVLVGGGWDSTLVENHLGIGVAALRRGYHVLLHDGPGQGRLLFEEGRPLRHDWEAVVTPVVDAALGLDGVDGDRLVYWPWSLGGYMAPRVAAHEPRLAAAVCDPGQTDMGAKLVNGLRMMGMTDEQVAALPAMDPEFEKGALAIIDSDRSLHWSLIQRGTWANGAAGPDDLQGFVAEMLRWRLDDDTLAAITTPMLVMSADDDRASGDAQHLYDVLTCPKARFHFTAAMGANMHCEMLNRPLANRVALDWLDDILGTPRAATGQRDVSRRG